MIPRVQHLLMSLSALGTLPSDDDATRLQKRILVTTALIVTAATLVWGSLYSAAGEGLAALIPFSYAALSIIGLVLLARTLRFDLFRFGQLLLGLLLPLLLTLQLGGFAASSVVILWAFLAPLGALLCWNGRQAVIWFGLFLVSLVAAGLLAPLLRSENALSDAAIMAFYLFNIGVVAGVAFVTILYFVGQKELAVRLLQRNRELERANLEQELMLRQSEKLATLGRLSAGVAHELNNPAAAVQRGAAQLGGSLAHLARTQFELGGTRLAEGDLLTLAAGDPARRGLPPEGLDPLERSDRESEIEEILEAAGIDDAWDLAPSLVGLGFEPAAVAALANTVPAEAFARAVASFTADHAARTLLAEIGAGAERISEIVAALKTYTYMDRTPRQLVDLHEGLDTTLVMLRSRLGDGVVVRRDYQPDLPPIEAFGGELNQLWTNLIDNAVDAMDGRGELQLCTRSDGDQVVVEITDSGSGIPPEIEANIFDPFFTTKQVGRGTGLGLNISRNIVEKHGGEIGVRSRPGETRFTVRLPADPPEESASDPAR